ncbi:hypothetical protein HBH79_228730 [Parastagonospora nodorum]|nr:hypothetical protein HBH99_234610 [Parastagonospora nodorum]KAH4649704.1 hypothetical protein HBH80_226170 [Parastagonospora nodorum]KAH4653984.1 hypothetical protein HBH79_228730 [Parastagonospora nodorum]KAH4848123.1 hypothetical protein HBH58_225720 [Parastagonospora nodorum]KAH5368739.1 hypothetical protein HBI33_180000 [Parastagonospora nodorum]
MDSGMPVRAVWISDGGPHTHWDRHTGATKKIDITPLEMALYDKNCIKAIEQAGVTCERIFLEFFCAIMRTLEKAHKHSLRLHTVEVAPGRTWRWKPNAVGIMCGYFGPSFMRAACSYVVLASGGSVPHKLIRKSREKFGS